jgi:hypothetical protein
VKAQSLSLSQAVVRLDAQYGNGAIVADLAGLSYVMRGKDYDLLDMQGVQIRLTQPPDQQASHPETGTCRALFDFPDLSLSPIGPRTRVIVATHPASSKEQPEACSRLKIKAFVLSWEAGSAGNEQSMSGALAELLRVNSRGCEQKHIGNGFHVSPADLWEGEA